MADAIVFSLPERPRAGEFDSHWWHVVDGLVVNSGSGTFWTEFASNGQASGRKQVALAPAAAVRLDFAERPQGASTDRQAAAVASVEAQRSSLGGPETLHSVSRAGPEGEITTAIVAASLMQQWLDWALSAGADPDHIVPAAALLPLGEGWTSASFGEDEVIGRTGLVMPFEPGLAERLVGESEIALLDAGSVEAAIVAAAVAPPLDLRTGLFARRRRLFVDRRRIRELLLLAAVIPLLILVWAMVAIVKLNQSTAELDRQSLAVAERTLGRTVTLETAESALSERAGASAMGGLMAPLTELLNLLQAEDSVSATGLSFSPDGTLSTTLASPTLEPVNRVIVALQRDGYRITAVTRQSPDGRAMVDTTIRSRP